MCKPHSVVHTYERQNSSTQVEETGGRCWLQIEHMNKDGNFKGGIFVCKQEVMCWACLKSPEHCPYGGKNMMKQFLGCHSSVQNVVKSPLLSPLCAEKTWWKCPLVPHRAQQVLFLLFSPLPLKHPESTSAPEDEVLSILLSATLRTKCLFGTHLLKSNAQGETQHKIRRTLKK